VGNQLSEIDKRSLRETLGVFATGVTVITGKDKDDDRRIGLTVNSFNAVSLDPPMVLWSIDHRSPNREHFKIGAPHLIHVLASDQADIAMHFATPNSDKFKHLTLDVDSSHDLPILERWAALLHCQTVQVITAGDHDVILAEVLSHKKKDVDPLIFVKGSFQEVNPQTRG